MREVLRDSRRDNREEIREGLAWLERWRESDEAVAQVVTDVGARA